MATASWKKILIPLIILIFPVVFWLVISSGTNHLKRLPILGPVEISEKGDTLFHTIAHFSMTNQDNRQITSNDLNGKIYVASFFFATCPDVCPKMNRQMERVQDAFRGSGEVRLLSFTVNPEHDSVSVLKDYSRTMHADSTMWWFLTGNKDSIYNLARESYLVPAAEGKTANDFFHAQDFILVDKESRIRGIYDGTEPADVDTLIDEVKVLMHEYVERKETGR